MSFMAYSVFAQVIMDELNGSTLGIATGITYTTTPNGQGAVFSRTSESRIEYPFSMGLPHQGTIEMLVKVTKAYSYDNYTLLDNQSNAYIFNSGPSDVWYLGAMWLIGDNTGNVSLTTALTATPTAHKLAASSTTFRFNEWHVLSFSYGSQGQYVKVDGQLVASNSSYTETLQTCGNWSSTRDNPTIGEMKSVFWGNNKYDQGIEGVLDRFRTSSTQQDWKLTLNTTSTTTSKEEKLAYSVTDGNLHIDNLNEGSMVHLYDMSGRLLYKQKPENDALILSLPQRGVYVIKIESKAGIQSQKIVW